jgi:hypothetical protein
MFLEKQPFTKLLFVPETFLRRSIVPIFLENQRETLIEICIYCFKNIHEIFFEYIPKVFSIHKICLCQWALMAESLPVRMSWAQCHNTFHGRNLRMLKIV